MGRVKTKKHAPSNTNGKGTLFPCTALYNGHLTAQVAARPVKNLVAVAVLLGVETFMRVAITVAVVMVV